MNFFSFIKDLLHKENWGLFSTNTDPQDLPPDLIARVEEKIAVHNIRRIVPFAGLIFFAELITQISLLIADPDGVKLGFYLLFGSYLLLLSLAAIFLSYQILKKPMVSVRHCQLLCRTFWWLFSFGMLTFDILEIYTRGSTNNYIYLLILTATFPLLPWKDMFFLFGVDTAVILPFACYSGMSMLLVIQLPLLAVFAWFLSRMLYNSFRLNQIMLEQLQESNAKLTDLASKDPLTGLFNRRGILEQLEKTFSLRAQPCRIGFLMIDIDLFKKYNDFFGHEQGDQCLKKVADAIYCCTMGSHNFASRFGGEEFLVVLTDCTETDLLETAQKLRQSILQLALKAASSEVSPYVTVSIGAAFLHGSFDFTQLYEQADRELYHAKASNRNCVSMNGEIYRE